MTFAWGGGNFAGPGQPIRFTPAGVLGPAAVTSDFFSVTAWISMNSLGDSAVHRVTSWTSALSMSLISDSEISRAKAAVSRLN